MSELRKGPESGSRARDRSRSRKARMYEDDEEMESKIELLSPDSYLKRDKILTLDDTKEYEQFIKKEFLVLHANVYIKNLVQNMDCKLPIIITHLLII